MSQKVEAVTVVEAAPQKMRRKPVWEGLLKPERVQEMLRAAVATMPGWKLARGILALDRVQQFPTPQVAEAFASFVSQFAAEVGQRCSITRTGEHVAVTVHVPAVRGKNRGLVKSVVDFAKRLG